MWAVRRYSVKFRKSRTYRPIHQLGMAQAAREIEVVGGVFAGRDPDSERGIALLIRLARRAALPIGTVPPS